MENTTKREDTLTVNKGNWQKLYSEKTTFLRYPADWIIRFHNLYLKTNIPKGRVLDYGCGTGNNSMFFLDKGYEVWGIDVAESYRDLVKANLESRNYRPELISNFSVMATNNTRLPYEDNFFDVIVANQVLYYLPGEEHIKKIAQEFSRCLKPGGAVFITMMGPKNYYIVYHAKQILNERVYEISFDKPGDRLKGYREYIYLVRDAEDLCNLFSAFKPVNIGYFDQSLFTVKSNFHWIFIGQKK